MPNDEPQSAWLLFFFFSFSLLNTCVCSWYSSFLLILFSLAYSTSCFMRLFFFFSSISTNWFHSPSHTVYNSNGDGEWEFHYSRHKNVIMRSEFTFYFIFSTPFHLICFSHRNLHGKSGILLLLWLYNPNHCICVHFMHELMLWELIIFMTDLCA